VAAVESAQWLKITKTRIADTPKRFKKIIEAPRFFSFLMLCNIYNFKHSQNIEITMLAVSWKITPGTPKVSVASADHFFNDPKGSLNKYGLIGQVCFSLFAKQEEI
jgi:hypothetical protein